MKDQEIKELFETVSDNWQGFKADYKSTIADLADRLDHTEASLDGLGPRVSGTGRGSADRKALADFMRTGDASELRSAPASKTITTGTPSQDAMVPETIAAEILLFERDTANLASIVRLTPVGEANYSRLLRVTPPGSSWVSETGTRSLTVDPGFRRRVPTHGENYAYLRVTDHLLDDGQFDLAQFLTEDVRLQFGRDLDTAIISGTGTDQPTGITNTAPAATADFASPLRSAEVIESIGVPSTDDFANHLMDAYFALQPEYRGRATWVMNSRTLNEVRQLRDSQNRFLWQPNRAAGVDADAGLLLGRPVVISEAMVDTGASPANHPIIVGDWRLAYELIRIGDMKLTRDPFTLPGFVNFYISGRFGVILMNKDALKAVAR